MLTKISIESPHLIPNGKVNVRDFIQSVPKTPGVYKFLDKSKNPLYIGKAKNLDKRIASYFRISSRSEKINKLFETAKYIELSITIYFLDCHLNLKLP